MSDLVWSGPVAHSGDAVTARRWARNVAQEMGFGEVAAQEVQLAVAELASNLCKHARGGRLRIAPVSRDGVVGIEILSEDRGPGIADPDAALADRFSTAGTGGRGLGAVHRLMDDFEMATGADALGGGTRIRCVRWLKAIPPAPGASPFRVGTALRKHLDEAVSGDAFVHVRLGDGVLVGVIDGLGHGPAAHGAASRARRWVERHPDASMVALFEGVSRECRSTRGVVMALARFDAPALRMTFGGVGNVEARVMGNPELRHLPSVRGVLGVGSHRPTLHSGVWPSSALLVLHSDGIWRGWQEGTLGAGRGASPQEMADALLSEHARPDDDAAVVVVGVAERGSAAP